MPNSGVPGSFDFGFLRILHNDFHSGCTSLHSSKVYKGLPLHRLLHHHQHLLFVSFIIAILTEVSWNFSAVLVLLFLYG
jgi:hypothetical protein